MPRLAAPDESTLVPFRKVPGGKRPMSTSEELRVLFVFSHLISHLLIVGSECYLAREQDALQLPCCEAEQNVKDWITSFSCLLTIWLLVRPELNSGDSVPTDKKVNDLLLWKTPFTQQTSNCQKGYLLFCQGLLWPIEVAAFGFILFTKLVSEGATQPIYGCVCVACLWWLGPGNCFV